MCGFYQGLCPLLSRISQLGLPPDPVDALHTQSNDISGEWSLFQHHQTADGVNLLIDAQELRKVNLQPPLNPVFRGTQLFQDTLPAVLGCSQLCIYSLRNVGVQISLLHHQLGDGLWGFLVGLFGAVVIHILALLHMIGIHKHQFHLKYLALSAILLLV